MPAWYDRVVRWIKTAFTHLHLKRRDLIALSVGAVVGVLASGIIIRAVEFAFYALFAVAALHAVCLALKSHGILKKS
jgi:hypothetical protein